MNFSEILNKKKKKNKMEVNQNPENIEQNETLHENETDKNEVSDGVEEGSEESSSENKESQISDEDKLKAEATEWQNKYLRLYAEFDNFKRRTSKERLELLQIAGKDVISDLLTVLDDFERAQKSIETATDVVAVKEGVTLVQLKLKSILNQKGLKEMESIGKEFDADLHEGITSIPAPSADLKGKVIDELEKGYLLNDKVIRFAKVIIGA
ncbi:nucleotide exchange factor GrpE [Daejeonella sp.]|uniref:nucleotide exchange factor GrpE n=1 Tax=Daejeonella sp. TaxID=2805397 RepID=UPI0027282F9D|nr:nucleotide exchange factor GrpE [Daejeonella sp.]MDO8991847.1 nucleotide exchange factor GrpE [Daejeonella sp.]MDP2415163.1 nucleotide exchange factor GrpE [Daejeonella sp.]